MFDRGYWTVMRWRGAPVRVHWSLALSALVLGGVRLDPAGWLGIVLVVLAHEVGHAVLVRRYRLTVESIDLHGLGGECRYSGLANGWQTAVIAWGGVLAQALLLPVGFWLAPHVENSFLRQLLASFGSPSLWILLLNLIPVPPLDGSEAWRLPGLWRRRRATLRRRRQLAHGARELGRLEHADHVRPAELRLPDDVAEQVHRAVRRAYEENEADK